MNMKSKFIIAMLAIVVFQASNATWKSAWAQPSAPDSGASSAQLNVDSVVIWEYLVKTFQVPGFDQTAGDFLRQSLNEAGTSGWELVSVVHDGRDGVMATFKRRK